MADLSENISVIQLKDPYLPEFMDFETLRKEGLIHIGNLSGSIWTDHNIHDPGVTILEVLVYALMDLGYKTNLPFKDIITLQNGEEDNFLTPLNILTVNPVTITDYRKLLLEIKGVRNAWLEPMEQEIPLYINQYNNELTCSRPHQPILNDSEISDSNIPNEQDPPLTHIPSNVETNSDGSLVNVPNERPCFVDDPKYLQIQLNGLYKVYIEKDADIIKNDDDQSKLIEDVKQLLNDHRNLCEDFVDICILDPLDIGVCVEVEILEGFDAAKIYTLIYKKVKRFIQPELTYYTLNELLEKGRTIDAIYSGRPYMEKSFGFIDTEELNSLERRSQINLSDLYHEILSIEGVRKIKNANIKGGTSINEPSHVWVEGNRIGSNQVPVFSIEKTCIDLYSSGDAIILNKAKIHQTFTYAKKFGLLLRHLDCEVPSGVFPDDISDYNSIQNDFPVVYGIGEDGLPESATLERRTQALQLKGYLTFYDQMLANYASQLGNIRSLFSLIPENERSSAQKQTYVSQISESIPGLDRLLRFYDQSDTANKGALLAVPIANSPKTQQVLDDLNSTSRPEFTVQNYCKDAKASVPLFSFSVAAHRAISINQLINSFYTEAYTISIYSDKFGYFFILNPELPNDILLVGTKRYASSFEATNEAKNIAFMASRQESYHLVTDTSETTDPDEHFFDISYQPVSYLNLIQELTENTEEYTKRRKQFLNHLLARFGEEFTAYTMLHYQSKMEASNLVQDTITDQSSYLNQFAEISRNRGKAFNYLKRSWNTDNVSGFEKRVSLLSGLNNYARRNLCNFEVTQCFRLILKDPKGTVLFRSNRSYETIEELHESARKVLRKIRDPEEYKRLGKKLNGFNVEAMNRIFSEKPNPENIVPSKHIYLHKLVNLANKVLTVSANMKMGSAKAAASKKAEFVEKINEQTHIETKSETPNYRLLALDGEHQYLDVNSLNSEIKTLISYKWHLKDIASNEITKSDIVFAKKEEAWQHMLENTRPVNYISKHDIGLSWLLKINSDISFSGLSMYPDAYKAVTAWRLAKMLGQSSKNFEVIRNAKTFKLELKNEKGSVVARSNNINQDHSEVTKIIEECISVFSNRKTKPKYPKAKRKYGFQIPKKDKTILLKSYCVYDSEMEALQAMGKTFDFGKDKKHYLQSGDEGNPEYNFILKDKNDIFIALPFDHFETASDRNKALTAMMRFYKNNALPVYIKEEPRRYVWSLYHNDIAVLESETEFTSIKKAQANFDKTVVKEASKRTHDFYDTHITELETLVVPVQYKFIYGDSSAQNEIEPLFVSAQSFQTYETAKIGYTNFIQKLPSLAFKSAPKTEKKYDFALYEVSNKTPIALQYNMGNVRASEERAKTLTSYVKNIYTKSGAAREQFVTTEMTENNNGLYEWRFYKKNAPIAKSAFCCSSADTAERLKTLICEIIPPIKLNNCPPKEVVVCPEKNPGKYHFQVCFKGENEDEFVLISFLGYDSYDEAKLAWEEQWLDIIQIAGDPSNYSEGGKISRTEVYSNPDSKVCKENSVIAVIPKKNLTRIKASGRNVTAYYVQLAHQYPIYKVENEKDEDCFGKYRFKVVITRDATVETSCKPLQNNEVGELIWTSTDCFDSICEAIDAYNHFYTITGSSTNCRILCENGCYYIGLVEVLLESSCEYETEALAWDDFFGESQDDCGDCVPGGMREFIYAADDCKNYIALCDQNYWTFKVVSPAYFVAKHNCTYNSERERDAYMDKWIEKLETLDCSKYFKNTNDNNEVAEEINSEVIIGIQSETSDNTQIFNEMSCDVIQKIRECLALCDISQKTLVDTPDEEISSWEAAVKVCLREKFKDDVTFLKRIDDPKFNVNKLVHITKYFPIYKTAEGYCFKLYWPENDIIVSEGGLQPCGCGEEVVEDSNLCNEKFPFVSSTCYSCCDEAIEAFRDFCRLIENKTYTVECTSKSEYGPYSFEILDKSKELAFHPQQYDSYQEVLDAIEITKNYANDTGMHVLEHILLRPTTDNDCRKYDSDGENNEQQEICCLLPVCPDYCCDIDWKPDADKEDPCAEDNPKIINYLPGSDPYSFWATLALPAWSKRFRTQVARKAFEKLLYEEVPALVGLNILWLSPRNLCKFEDTYRKWLEWKEDPKNLCGGNEISIKCKISDCIRDLVSEKPCPTPPGALGDCNCKDGERSVNDVCCLPHIIEGSLFWGPCVQRNYDDNFGDTINHLSAISNAEKETLTSASKGNHKKKPRDVDSTLVAKKSKASALKKVRQRKPKYLANVKAIVDEKMATTKSYERVEFFLKNKPTVKEYENLVNHFNRYSLKDGNKVEGFLNLLKNATWHLLDTLALEKSESLKNEDLNQIKKSLQLLKDKGLSINKLNKEWNSKELQPYAYEERLSQLKKMLK